jgi:hypothetical protein
MLKPKPPFYIPKPPGDINKNFSMKEKLLFCTERLKIGRSFVNSWSGKLQGWADINIFIEWSLYFPQLYSRERVQRHQQGAV